MSFWKFGLCLALLAVALSDQKPFEETEEISLENLKVIRTIPKFVENIPKEVLQRFVDLIKSNADGTTIVNAEVDKFIANLNNHIIMEGLDPVELQEEGFEFKWFLISGKMKLENGWLQGLATLERVKDCTLDSSGEISTLKLSLTFTDMLFSYDYTAKFMGIGPKGGIDGAIRNSKFTITVTVNTKTCEATLEKFKLDKQGTLSIKLTGNGLSDFFINMLTSVVIIFLGPVFKIFISSWVQGGVITILVFVNKWLWIVIETCVAY